MPAKHTAPPRVGRRYPADALVTAQGVPGMLVRSMLSVSPARGAPRVPIPRASIYLGESREVVGEYCTSSTLQGLWFRSRNSMWRRAVIDSATRAMYDHKGLPVQEFDSLESFYHHVALHVVKVGVNPSRCDSEPDRDCPIYALTRWQGARGRPPKARKLQRDADALAHGVSGMSAKEARVHRRLLTMQATLAAPEGWNRMSLHNLNRPGIRPRHAYGLPPAFASRGENVRAYLAKNPGAMRIEVTLHKPQEPVYPVGFFFVKGGGLWVYDPQRHAGWRPVRDYGDGDGLHALRNRQAVRAAIRDYMRKHYARQELAFQCAQQQAQEWMRELEGNGVDAG